MAFQPDILITTPDGIALVVEAKITLPNLRGTEDSLKRYMVAMQCPVGLLITPDRMWVYRDSYSARSSESIERVGEFNLESLWHQPPPLEGARFETFVQQWLADLSRQQTDELPYGIRETLQEYILPAVEAGEIRAAHPRYS